MRIYLCYWCCWCWWLVLVLLVLLAPWLLSEALVCISHHEYYEDGKIRVINSGRCGSSNGFCVKARYWDNDESRKRGFSRGCDKNDCYHFGEKEYGWRSDGCRKDLDFGSDGYICCCKHDLCNDSSSTRYNNNNKSVLFTSILFVIFISQFIIRSSLQPSSSPFFAI